MFFLNDDTDSDANADADAKMLMPKFPNDLPKFKRLNQYVKSY